MLIETLIAWTAVYVLVAMLVIFFNGLVLVSFFKNKTLRTRTNYFIASLAWADFLVGAISIPGWLALVLTTYYGWEYNLLMLDVWTSFDMLAGIGSIYHLMALSWDRLCAIVWPLKHRLYTRRKYIYILCLVWGCALLVSGFSTIGNKADAKLYNILVIGVCFFLPLLVVLVTQGTIFVKIRHTERQHIDQQNSSHSRSLKREVRAAKAISIMVFLFVIGWLPFFTISLLSFAAGVTYTANAIFAVKLLQYSNSFFNPILYAQKFPEFRRAYVRMLCRCNHKDAERRLTYHAGSGTYKSIISHSPKPSQRARPTRVDYNGSVSVVSSTSTERLRDKSSRASSTRTSSDRRCDDRPTRYHSDTPSLSTSQNKRDPAS
ncbi:beta-1 adrenergic receptor isoform X2 [Nematostella vectensis]|nr:beta-1 adrenergic receptor isoform X2 [Nematostella vectensis]